MFRIVLILKLPNDLFVSLLTEWIDVVTFAHLDSATCNLANRSSLLKFCREIEYFTFEGYDSTCGFVDNNNSFESVNLWTQNRGFKMRRIMFTWDELNEPCSTYNLSRILRLELVGTQCGSNIASKIVNECKKLEDLVLYHVDNHNAIIQLILNEVLSNIQHLHIWPIPGNPIFLASIARISEVCTTLSHLNLGISFFSSPINETSYLISETLCTVLKNNTKLKCINLHHNLMDDQVLYNIGTYCKYITTVYISGAKISLESILDLRDARAGTLLHMNMIVPRSINAAPYLSPSGIFFMSTTNGERTVKFEGFGQVCSSVTGRVFDYPNIAIFSVVNHLVGDCHLYSLAFRSPHLTLLHCDSCGDSCTKPALMYLFMHCHKLNKVHFGNMAHLSNNDLIELFEAISFRLEVLSFDKHPNLTHEVINIITNKCSSLKTVVLCHCEQVEIRFVKCKRDGIVWWEVKNYLSDIFVNCFSEIIM